MIKSMTGYGRAVHNLNGREITVEIRSVNNRYLDCSVRLPRIYNYAEERVKQLVKANVSRGKVDVFVSIVQSSDEEISISLNKSVLEGYLSVMHRISEEYGVKDDITVTSLTRMPDIFLTEKPDIDEEARAAEILTVVQEAIEKYNAMRVFEGQAMKDDLLLRRQTILSLIQQVEQRSPMVINEYKKRLFDKIQEVLENKSLDEGRILSEVAIFADRIAVDEETVRLRSHLTQMSSMLSNGGVVGRKLDFLIQEMNREANTIGSKSNDLQQTQIVVDIKAELEKIREQIQNIE